MKNEFSNDKMGTLPVSLVQCLKGGVACKLSSHLVIYLEL